MSAKSKTIIVTVNKTTPQTFEILANDTKNIFDYFNIVYFVVLPIGLSNGICIITSIHSHTRVFQNLFATDK